MQNYSLQLSQYKPRHVVTTCSSLGRVSGIILIIFSLRHFVEQHHDETTMVVLSLLYLGIFLALGTV